MHVASVYDYFPRTKTDLRIKYVRHRFEYSYIKPHKYHTQLALERNVR